MIISITGTTGNMGGYFLRSLNDSPDVADKIKILCRSAKKAKKILNACKRVKGKTEVIWGDVSDPEVCKRLVEGCDIVFNICSVIPPKADSDPKATVACNVQGAKNVIAAVEALGERQPALIHISSVAVYGNRCGAHMYGRVGEPLVSGPFELYSATKILGEYAVLQSDVKKWAVLRQTAMLHYNMFSDNIHDGLMFHTPVNAPLEWATVKDSGRLLLNIVKRAKDGSMPEEFWRRVYNIGGGMSTRAYGYQTYDAGFKIIGGGFTDFFKPYYNATRNFHGMFYTDSDELENYFRFRSQSGDDFWKEMADTHKIFKLGKLVPKKLLAACVIKPLLKDKNAPTYWLKNGDGARATAYFGGYEKYEELKKKTWADVELKTAVEEPAPMSLEERVEAYGYDIEKSDNEITKDDVIAVAEAHGGRALNPEAFDGDMYKKLDWETQDGEVFSASAYTVMRAGHWEHALYKNYAWDFDRLSKKDRIFGRIWYDSHEKDEDVLYYFDENFVAHADKRR